MKAENVKQKKGYEISIKKATDLHKLLSDDLERNYFTNFPEVEEVIKSVINKLYISIKVVNNELSLNAIEINTLKANSYISGTVLSWYYPELKNNMFITLNK